VPSIVTTVLNALYGTTTIGTCLLGLAIYGLQVHPPTPQATLAFGVGVAATLLLAHLLDTHQTTRQN
jgi:hypothetical protein